MSAHDDWVQDVIATVRMVGEDFTEPDDDWAHVLLGRSIDGRKVAVDLSGAFQNGKGKEALASSLLPQLIVQQQLQRVALVTSAWIVWAADDMGEQVRPSQHPRRKEVVSVYACSDGVESISMAEIKRDGVRPPWLAGWQQMSTQDRNAASFAGLFAPPLRAAVNVVRRGKRL